ncbi:MAG: selenocysteine-specific translation elongation factor [Deltaproteobacteria bacterium]|nr:MAG: selenocysteine-specific translation elongation factor [Deltaproteobacteria bacterium]
MKKFVTVGISGHVDHGKTALVRCLTGIDTDRLQEEKRRGLSIESGIAPLELSSGTEIALVDVPGHTDFLKNTIRGLSGVDAAILVVAADDGVMPQTLEHIQILNFLGAKGGFIVLTKSDLVDDETLDLADLEIRETVEGTFLEEKPIIPFSAIDQRGLHEIRIEIKKVAEKISQKDLDSPFRLWIDQIRSFAGFGTVASGTILSGIIREHDLLLLLPPGIQTRARSLETHHENVSEACAGQRVGINLHKVSLKDVRRGMVLVKPGTLDQTYLLNVDLEILKSAKKPIKNRQRVKLYLGTSITNSLVVLMEKDQLQPGERGLAQLRLMKPVASLPKDHFVISLMSIPSVIGGGRVLEIPKEKYRQTRATAIIPYLSALQEGNLKAVVDHFFTRILNRPLTADEIARNSGFSPLELEEELKARVKSGELIHLQGKRFFAKNHYRTLKRQLLEVVEKILTKDPLKMTATAEEVREELAASLDDALFQRMLAELCNKGKLIKINGSFRIRDLSVRLSNEREKLITMLLDYAQESGFVPFSADTFWKAHKRKYNKNEIQRLLDYLHGQKRLIRLNNRRFLSPQAMEKIKGRVRRVIGKNGRLTIGDCKEVLGYGRTVGVPVFEYLDSIGFTVRQGDERVLNTD